MEGSASACRRRGRTRCVVAGALVAAALAAAPAVRADPGSAQGETAAAEAADPQGAAGTRNDAPGNSGNTPGHAAEPGDSGNPPGHAVAPADSGGAPGHGDEPGNSGNAPGHQDDTEPSAQVDQGASIGQSAGASASADQRDVGNTAAAVRVDEPGNGKKVGQENRAVADAGASTTATVDSVGDATVAQSAQADAGSSQADVSNTSIVVRVGSAGDDEGVSQANLATGVAGATSTAEPVIGIADASARATQAGVTNTSVSVRVFSPGDDGLVTQLNAVSATADASPGGTETAVARQEGVQNTTVSVRVESPGASADPVQENRATVVTSPSQDADEASGAGAVAVAVAGDARNTVLTVAVGGASLDRPGAGGLQVWVWTWVWQRDEAEDLGDLVGLAPDSWSWSWDGTTAPRGTVTTRAADADELAQAGSLEWIWDWTRAGVAGWTWDWNRRLPLSCASCIWIWDWSWSWAGRPGDEYDLLSPAIASPPSAPGQLNAVAAQARASAAVGLGQTVAQEGSGGTQFAGQLADVSQDVSAVAAAQQADVRSVMFGSGPGQSNLVTSVADAALGGTLTQMIAQSLFTSGQAAGDQWGGQQVAVSQVAGAGASASQHDVLLTGAGIHAATSDATAAATAAVEQQLVQGAGTRGGTLSQWAGQLAIVEQTADASSAVHQAGSAGSRRSGGAAVAAAAARDLALVAQHAEQATARDGGLGSQSAMQAAFTGQEASASATTAQQAGTAALRSAGSDAEAVTRSSVLQAASQRVSGSSLVVQDLVQESIVVQRAIASSTSTGGVAGRAAVVDCAVVQQGATQSFGADRGPVSLDDDLAFCLPEAASATSPPVVLEPPTAAGGETLAAAVAVSGGENAGSAPGGAPLVGIEASARHGRPAVGRPAVGLPAFGRSPSTSGAPSAPPTPRAPLLARLVPGHTEFSAPPSPQARIDTRPESHAAAGDAGREPPLPPVGDPPNWVSALAAAASGAGTLGIAAILFVFALVAPFVLCASQGSVVRRPAGVLARIDVPV